MKTKNLSHELETEHDLTKLTIRRVGHDREDLRKSEIQLDVDVAEVFPDSESVNEALRFLIRITKEHRAELNQK